jgi:anaerobic magnesium-protoporphyrin IX monomethyl ester cyclase
VWPPLNLSLLAAVCESRGHEAKIIDGEVLRLDTKELAKQVVATNPDVAAFSMYSPFAHLAADVSAEIKKLNADIVVVSGGPHATILKEQAMKPSFDYLFMGEAERSLPDFLDALDAHKDISKVGGIVYRGKSGELINTGEAQWLTEVSMRGRDLGGYYPLDDLPLPARHLLPMQKYMLGTMDGRQHFSSIQSFRGCPWRCVFCSRIFMWSMMS